MMKHLDLVRLTQLYRLVAFLSTLDPEKQEAVARDLTWIRGNLPTIEAIAPAPVAEHFRSIESEISAGVDTLVRWTSLTWPDRRVFSRYLELCFERAEVLSPEEAGAFVGGITPATGREMVASVLRQLGLLETITAGITPSETAQVVQGRGTGFC